MEKVEAVLVLFRHRELAYPTQPCLRTREVCSWCSWLMSPPYEQDAHSSGEFLLSSKSSGRLFPFNPIYASLIVCFLLESRLQLTEENRLQGTEICKMHCLSLVCTCVQEAAEGVCLCAGAPDVKAWLEACKGCKGKHSEIMKCQS